MQTNWRNLNFFEATEGKSKEEWIENQERYGTTIEMFYEIFTVTQHETEQLEAKRKLLIKIE